MDFNNSKLVEKAAEMLSGLEFDESELGAVFIAIQELAKNQPLFQSLFETILSRLQEMELQADFRNVSDVVNNDSNSDLIHRFFFLLLKNPNFQEKIQSIAINKFLKKADKI